MAVDVQLVSSVGPNRWSVTNADRAQPKVALSGYRLVNYVYVSMTCPEQLLVSAGCSNRCTNCNGRFLKTEFHQSRSMYV
jgi:hypothetical protein